MQFYMIEEDAAKSAASLPAAMIRVNVREGWQILSDIGHHLGVYWPGQNAAYNLNHPTTMRMRESHEAFQLFRHHYLTALDEYERRFGKTTVWHGYIMHTPLDAMLDRLWGRTRWETMKEYLRLAKGKQISADEFVKIL